VSNLPDFFTVLGAVLVLLPLYTSQRAERIRSLSAPGAKPHHATQELVITFLLFLFTVATLVFAAPMIGSFVDDVNLTKDGAAPALAVASWCLLAVLAVWQLTLTWEALQERRNWYGSVPRS
jgi:hypothetical protein